MDELKEILHIMRQYQQGYLDYEIDRVHLYFDDVEGNWLEEFEAIEEI